MFEYFLQCMCKLNLQSNLIVVPMIVIRNLADIYKSLVARVMFLYFKARTNILNVLLFIINIFIINS